MPQIHKPQAASHTHGVRSRSSMCVANELKLGGETVALIADNELGALRFAVQRVVIATEIDAAAAAALHLGPSGPNAASAPAAAAATGPAAV